MQSGEEGSIVSDARMVSGPAIACCIFFEVTPQTTEEGFNLRALSQHEVWLESTELSLEALTGRLHISNEKKGIERSVGHLTRDGAGYELALHAIDPAVVQKLRRLQPSETLTLVAIFDVEYQQGYESPGGYSSEYGIRYWDDRRYPVVELSRFEVVQD